MSRGDLVRFIAGHRAAAERGMRARAAEGPRPEQAIAECLAALNAAFEMGVWPGPRDPVSEAGVERVRSRWALVQRRAQKARIG